MDMPIRRQASDSWPGPRLSADARSQLIRHYRMRLARLLASDLPPSAELTGRELRRLHGWATLATVRALTELGVGWAAGDLLRQAGRQRRLAQVDARAIGTAAGHAHAPTDARSAPRTISRGQ